MTVKQAAEKAKLQELTVEAIFKKHQIPYKGNNSGRKQPLNNFRANNQGVAKGNLYPRAPQVPSMVRSSSLEQRRQLGLCFKCGENYSPGH